MNHYNTVTMFCKNLAYKVTEKDLKNLFKKNIGVEIATTRDNLSRGYGFVYFANEDDLKEALETKTLDLHGRVMELKRAVADDQSSATSNTLYIRGLTKNMTEDVFKKEFKGVVDVRIFKDLRTKEIRGFCHVEFESLEMAEKAYKSTRNGLHIEGIILEVKYALSRNKDRPNREIKDTLYIKGVGKHMDKEVFRKHLEGVAEVRISKNYQTGENFEYCFVQFESEEMAEKAYQSTRDGLIIDGNKLEVSHAVSAKKRNTLFIGGITEDIPEEAFREKLEGVINVRIMKRFEDRRNKGYCFVDFESDAQAEKVFRLTKDGLNINGKTLRVRYAKGKER